MKNRVLVLSSTAVALTVAILLAVRFASGGGYTRYQKEYYDLFDTVTVIRGYAKSQAQFDTCAQAAYDEMLRLHRLFDIYHTYDGINNLKTVNDNAGDSWVGADPSIIELLLLAKSFCVESGGRVNVAMGSVLRVWHEERERAWAEPDRAGLPQMRELELAAENADIDDLYIDQSGGRVFLAKSGMSLDVGAIAKGFAAQKGIEAAARAGLESGFISAGGNVSVLGKPLDGREAWSVGIESPFESEDGTRQLFDTVFVTDMAVVTSGDYQRFYTADGQNYHHIIDPDTLMPAGLYRAATVLHPDSTIADMLSTVIFILPRERGEQLLRKYGAEAVWILPDGGVYATEGYKTVSKSLSQ